MQTDCRLCVHFRGKFHPLIINLILCGITGEAVEIEEGQCECFTAEDNVIDACFNIIENTESPETEILYI